MKQIISAICIAGVLMSLMVGMAAAGDFNLYRVNINSQDDADALSRIRPGVLCPVHDGYLIVLPSAGERRLTSAGLTYTPVAGDVDPGSLYRDNRLRQSTPLNFPVVFQEKGLCIYAIDPPVKGDEDYASYLDPIAPRNLPIKYSMPSEKTFSINRLGYLDTLINSISQDTLTQYVELLQSYYPRGAGTPGNTASAYWIKNMLENYGYDSVAIDTGTWEHSGDVCLSRNVLAYKPGSVYPYHQIILGAHRDAEENSPGADDNGSGTAGVMDIARVLNEYDNRMTIIYILFDAEEYGMGGSNIYAERAYNRGDHIELMVNFDMIGHYENENDVYANYEFQGDSTYAGLWIYLADSIPGIGLVGHPDNYDFSDEQPFIEYGYKTLWIWEYILSTVFHTPQDSTTYMNFDYMTRIVKTTLATIHTVDQNFEPDYELFMTGPQYPEMLVPEMATPIEIIVLEYGGATLVPGSVLLHYIIDETDSTAVEMTAMGEGLYTADLPALSCGHIVNYFVTAEDDSLGILNYPTIEGGIRAYVSGDLTLIFDDNFEEDLGWTVSGDASPMSHWEIADPSDYIPAGAPPTDYDGNDLCYITGSGHWINVDNGTTTLVSPSVDASGGDLLVHYARWYSNDQILIPGNVPHADTFKVYLSNDDGEDWTLVETVGPVEQASGGWYLHEFWISDFLEPTAYMRLRFDASDLGEDSHVEAAVDAVKFIDLSDGPRIITESLPNWTAGVPYSQQLEAIVCSGEITWTDKHGHLDDSWLVLSPSGLLSGTPIEPNFVYFIALATGESGGIDDHAYSFSVNPALIISTSSISNGIIGEYMEKQLQASGGTGARTWSDRDEILLPSGLTLSAEGVLSGTPIAVGDFSFTAQVTDAVGAVAERYYSFRIREPFVCGDANGDEGVNVGDVVYIISYVFSGGPPPDILDAGDVNNDGGVNVADAVYLINYIFKSGPLPSCP